MTCTCGPGDACKSCGGGALPEPGMGPIGRVSSRQTIKPTVIKPTTSRWRCPQCGFGVGCQCEQGGGPVPCVGARADFAALDDHGTPAESQEQEA